MFHAEQFEAQMNRRGFLAGILASGVAPYVVTTAGLLMRIRPIEIFPSKIWIPNEYSYDFDTDTYSFSGFLLRPTSTSHHMRPDVLGGRVVHDFPVLVKV